MVFTKKSAGPYHQHHNKYNKGDGISVSSTNIAYNKSFNNAYNNSPTMAPGSEPMPPKTAAAKVLSYGKCHSRINSAVISTIIMPATAASSSDEGQIYYIINLNPHEIGSLGVLGNRPHGNTCFCPISDIREYNHHNNGHSQDYELHGIQHHIAYRDHIKMKKAGNGIGL